MSDKQRLKRAAKYERILARIRERYSFYYETGRAAKASHLISKCKLLATPLWVYRQKQRNAAFAVHYGRSC